MEYYRATAYHATPANTDINGRSAAPITVQFVAMASTPMNHETTVIELTEMDAAQLAPLRPTTLVLEFPAQKEILARSFAMLHA